ncbi:unnamed protein product, partial [Discosporangium mesarthrocarpum]
PRGGVGESRGDGRQPNPFMEEPLPMRHVCPPSKQIPPSQQTSLPPGDVGQAWSGTGAAVGSQPAGIGGKDERGQLLEGLEGFATMPSPKPITQVGQPLWSAPGYPVPLPFPQELVPVLGAPSPKSALPGVGDGQGMGGQGTEGQRQRSLPPTQQGMQQRWPSLGSGQGPGTCPGRSSGHGQQQPVQSHLTVPLGPSLGLGLGMGVADNIPQASSLGLTTAQSSANWPQHISSPPAKGHPSPNPNPNPSPPSQGLPQYPTDLGAMSSPSLVYSSQLSTPSQAGIPVNATQPLTATATSMGRG